MKVRFFVVAARGRLQKVSRAQVEALWEGRLDAGALGCPPGKELRLVSVFCDSQLTPSKLYLLRLPLQKGRCTLESHLTLQLFASPDCVTPGEMVDHHTAGWPADFFPQLAVALDVPLASLEVPLGVGGPLLVAAARRVTPRQALRFFR